MKKPYVSVIIPTYNRSAYVRKAIESVFSQTHNNFEIIVVDDGSTDDTGTLVSAYGNNLVYIRQDNSGPSSARNLGISIANGEFIAFLDSDDLWRYDKLELQLKLFEENPHLGLVASGHDVMNHRGEFILRYILKPHELNQLRKRRIYRNFFSTPSVVVRKSCFDSAGIFNEELYFAEDWDMWLRVLSDYSVEFVNEPLVTIREHSESLTREYSDRNLSDWESVIARHRSCKSLFIDSLTLKRYSWFYWNKAGIFRKRGEGALDLLFRSILFWPFGNARRYPQLLKWIAS